MSFAPERPIGCDPGQRQKRFSPAAARHGGSAAGPTPALKGPASARVSGAKWGDVINWRLSFEASAEGLAEHPWQSWVSAACAELPRPPSTHSQPRPTALSPPCQQGCAPPASKAHTVLPFQRPLLKSILTSFGQQHHICGRNPFTRRCLESLSQLPQTSLCINSKKKALSQPPAAALSQRVQAPFFLPQGPRSLPLTRAGEPQPTVCVLPGSHGTGNAAGTASARERPRGLCPKAIYWVRAGKC